MESAHTDRGLLQDLALIYIAFAHGTDEDLSDDEVNVIAGRLNEWRDDTEFATVLGAVKNAVDEYVRDDASDLVANAIRRIRLEVAPLARQAVIDDLMDIAMADDIFRHAESSFIKELEDAWDLHQSEKDGADGSFSVIDRSEQYGGWTAMHDLALIYLTLAHSTDRDLSTEEVDAITSKLAEWMPEAEESDILLVIQGAMSAYAQGPDKRMFAESVESVGRHVPEHQHEALLNDLQAVAEADGRILDEEQRLIDQLREAWANQATPS